MGDSSTTEPYQLGFSIFNYDGCCLTLCHIFVLLRGMNVNPFLQVYEIINFTLTRWEGTGLIVVFVKKVSRFQYKFKNEVLALGHEWCGSGAIECRPGQPVQVQMPTHTHTHPSPVPFPSSPSTNWDLPVNLKRNGKIQ